MARLPGPGPGPRAGVAVGGAGVSVVILHSMIMPPGHFQVAPASLAWPQVCGPSKSFFFFGGVRVLPGPSNCQWTKTMLRSSGNASQDVTQPGRCQGKIVCVHTVVEQFNHRLIPTFSQRRLACGAGSHP